MALVEMLGEKLQGKDGAEVATSSVSSTYVGLYFSAHWCPPCRGFTPVLADFYNDFTAKEENKGKLEIVFVSSDQTQESCDEYYKAMPWLCLPFAYRDGKKKLCQKFGVEGIPNFIILNRETGAVVCADARSALDFNPNGDKFPWQSE